MYRLSTRWGSGEVAHAIEPDALVVVYEKTGKRDVVAFQDITTLNLRQELPGAWTMRLSRKRGSTLTIPARHFVAFGQFELRAAEYRAFVDALHRASRAVNPRIRYVTGSSGLYVLGLVLLVFNAVFAVLIAYGFATGTPPRLRVLGILPLGVLVAAAFVKQGRAKPYDPAAPPAAFLPPVDWPALSSGSKVDDDGPQR
jgi:hypothetical protein